MKTLAAICTTYYPLSHADVIVTRWLEPHPHDVAHGFVPQTTIGALYVAQRPGGAVPADFAIAPAERAAVYDPAYDIAQLISERYGVPVYNSVRAALTLGGETLAVDGVLLIGEHGDYPQNRFDQKLYPRKELFDAIIAVFRESGRSVPLFCDKHLSWNGAWAREMVATARELGFGLMAGSSISLVGTTPDLGIAPGARLTESLSLFYVHPEIYGFHALELIESLIERRTGGSRAIASLEVWRGDEVWAALEDGALPHDLFDAALAAARVHPGEMRQNCAGGLPPFAARLVYADGHCATHMMLDGHVDDFAVALRDADRGVLAARYGTSDDWRAEFAPHFATLDGHVQQLMLSGRSPVPIARTLFTTQIVARWMQALAEPRGPILTSELAVDL